MATITNQEAADRVREIQETMAELAGELKEIAGQLDDIHAERSVVANLQCLIDDNHGYMSRDYNLTRWIADLERDEGDDELRALHTSLVDEFISAHGQVPAYDDGQMYKPPRWSFGRGVYQCQKCGGYGLTVDCNSHEPRYDTVWPVRDCQCHTCNWKRL